MSAECFACHGSLEGQPVLEAIDHTYHPECFRCVQCKNPFENNKFLRLDGEPFCSQTCIDARHASTTCVACGKNISVSVASLTALGGTWHAECFCCSACGKALGSGKFVVDDNQPFCDTACLAAAKPQVCPACGEVIVGDALIALDAHWHASCFRCTQCNATFPDGKFVRNADNKPFCNAACSQAFADAASPTAPDASATSTSTTTHTTTASSAPPVSAPQPAAPAASEAPDAAPTPTASSSGQATHGTRDPALPADPCCACGDLLEDEFLIALDRKYHEACLKCLQCGSHFPNLRFSHWDGKIFCNQTCLDDWMPDVICQACDTRISGAAESIEALGGFYHVPCFVCAACGADFGDELTFQAHQGKPYCSSACNPSTAPATKEAQ